MQTHVCVLQTAIDLTESGYKVHLVRDATASQRQLDKDVAIEVSRQFGLKRVSKIHFKSIRKLCPEKSFSGITFDRNHHLQWRFHPSIRLTIAHFVVVFSWKILISFKSYVEKKYVGQT